MDLIPLTNDSNTNISAKHADMPYEDSDDEFDKDPLNAIFSLYSMLEKEPRKLQEHLDDLRETYKRGKKLYKKDLDLAEYLTELGSTNNGKTLSAETFQSDMNSLESEAIIVYSQNADVYRVYGPGEMDNFIRNLSTHYSKTDKNGPMYEVIRDNFPQKLIIVVKDLETSQVPIFKDIVISFLKKHGMALNFDKDNYMIYNDGNAEDRRTHFIFRNICLKNDDERRNIIKRLSVFMEEKKYKYLAEKIQNDPPPYLIYGAKMYSLPSNMNPVGISKQTLEETLKFMLNVANQSDAKLVNFNVNYVVQNITNNNNSNNINSGNTNTGPTTITNNTTIIDNSGESKTIKKFFKHIYESRPKWYKEGQLVSMSVIEKAYNDYFGGVTPKNIISRNLNQKMFLTSERTSKTVNKRLVYFNELRKYFI